MSKTWHEDGNKVVIVLVTTRLIELKLNPKESAFIS